VPGLIFGEEDLVEFLTRPDTDDLDLTIGGDDSCKIGYSHAGDLGNEYLSAFHRLDAPGDETRALFQRQPEPRHALVGYCNPALFLLFQEERDDAPHDFPTTFP